MATFATNALHYRGIGSGIVRILAEYPEIEIVNDVSGKEFNVIVWRKEYRTSTQKTDNSTQISTQKVEESTQINTQKVGCSKFRYKSDTKKCKNSAC